MGVYDATITTLLLLLVIRCNIGKLLFLEEEEDGMVAEGANIRLWGVVLRLGFIDWYFNYER